MMLQSAVPATFERSFGGETRRFAVMSLNDWVDFCEWMNAQAAAKPGTHVPLDAMLDAATTTRGIRWIIARSLSKNGTKVTEQDVGAWCGLPHTVLPLLWAIADLPEAAEGSGRPTAAAGTSTGANAAPP